MHIIIEENCTSDIIIHGIAPNPRENAITMTRKKLKVYTNEVRETNNRNHHLCNKVVFTHYNSSHRYEAQCRI